VTPNAKNDLYLAHAAPNTVPTGNLRSDISLKTMVRAAQIVLATHTVTRKLLPMKLDLEKYQSADFRYDTSSAEEVHRRLQNVPLSREGTRWIHKQDGAMFYGVRHLELPYDEFVHRVDVSRVGDCFRDVLGIRTHVLHRNSAGRPLLQVERIAALAQPRYAAFLGKDELDVYKLEWMEYGPDEERNWMRTVCSPNGSTLADDGYMSFSRLPDGATKIEFVANQSFPLPRLLVLLRITRWVWLRTFLTKLAYRRFWRSTVNNMLARYQGREIVWIGRPSEKSAESGRRTGAAGGSATY
jgi:hypothetical protein